MAIKVLMRMRSSGKTGWIFKMAKNLLKKIGALLTATALSAGPMQSVAAEPDPIIKEAERYKNLEIRYKKD